MKYLIFSLIVIFCIFESKAQTPEFEPKGSFKVEIGLPNNITNKAFRELMQGLVVVTPSYQYTFLSSLAVGVGLRYGYFNVNQFKNNEKLSGGLHFAGGFVKVGQEKFFGRFGIDYGVRMGYGMDFFVTNKNKEILGKPFMEGSIFVEPHLGLVLLSGENNSFRLGIGYAIHPNQFRPEVVGLDNFSGMDLSTLGKITSYLSVGFGYTYFFGKKSTTN